MDAWRGGASERTRYWAVLLALLLCLLVHLFENAPFRPRRHSDHSGAALRAAYIVVALHLCESLQNLNFPPLLHPHLLHFVRSSMAFIAAFRVPVAPLGGHKRIGVRISAGNAAGVVHVQELHIKRNRREMFGRLHRSQISADKVSVSLW